MKIRIAVILGSILAILFASADTLIAQGQIPTPTITSISPGGSERDGAYPGDQIIVTGTGFATRDRQYSNANHPYEASVAAIIDGNTLGMRTIAVSSGRLSFVLPEGTPCGSHTMMARNRNTVISGSAVESEEVVKFFVACGIGRLDPSPVVPSIYEVQPNDAEPGSLIRIVGENFLPPYNNDQLTVLLFRGEKHEVEFSSSTEVRFLIPEDTPCSNDPYEIKVVNEVFRVMQNNQGQFFYTAPYLDVESKPSDLSVPCANQPPPPANEDPPPPPPVEDPPLQPPPPPVNNNGNNLDDYDSDGDCMINDGEFFNLIDAWIGEQVDNLLFFSGVDAWIAQMQICSATASSAVRFQPRGSQLLILNPTSTLGPVSIYDTAGALIHRMGESGRQLVWDSRDSGGNQIANGIYFVRFEKTGEVRKLLVLR